MEKKTHYGILPEGESPFESFPAPFKMVYDYTKKYSNVADVKEGKGITFAVKAVIFLIGLLTWNAAYAFGAYLGRLFYLFRLRKSIAIRNLDIAYGDKKTQEEKEAIYKASLITFGRVVVNYLRLPFQGEDFWRDNITITNEDLLQKAMNRKKGLLMLSGHIGTWDLAAGKLGMAGYPIAVVGKQAGVPAIDKIVIDTRISMNLGSIGTKNAMRRIFAGFKQGEIIAMALDQNLQQRRGMFINWFGTPASSVRSASYVARETDVPVLCGTMFQRGPKTFEVMITEELTWQSHSEDPEDELTYNAQLMSDSVEAIIRDNPGEWFWIHRRWKNQPPGMPDLYM